MQDNKVISRKWILRKLSNPNSPTSINISIRVEFLYVSLCMLAFIKGDSNTQIEISQLFSFETPVVK